MLPDFCKPNLVAKCQPVTISNDTNMMYYSSSYILEHYYSQRSSGYCGGHHIYDSLWSLFVERTSQDEKEGYYSIYMHLLVYGALVPSYTAAYVDLCQFFLFCDPFHALQS